MLKMNMMKKGRVLFLICLLLTGMIPVACGAEIGDYSLFYRSESVCHEIVTVGESESSVCITWLSKSDRPKLLFVTPASTRDAAAYSSSLCMVKPTESCYQGLWRCSTQVNGLTSGTEYKYCIAAPEQLGKWSVQRKFRFSPGECSEFLIFGDPQIGGSKNREQDQKSFQETVSAATQAAPNASFAVYMGDIKHTKILDDRDGIKEARKEYSSFKRAVNAIGVPSAIVCGNHDILEDDCAFLDEFAAPIGRWNTRPDSDYAFQQGQTLFLVINTNHTNTWEHVRFLNESMEQHPDARWKVLFMHHTFYPMSSAKDQTELSSLKERLTEACSETGIDVVISAHNHFYSRTTPLDEYGRSSDSGPVYLSLNSSSGSIYLDPRKKALSDGREVVEILRQDYHPNYTRCRVNENSFLIETFDVETGEVIDTITLNR